MSKIHILRREIRPDQRNTPVPYGLLYVSKIRVYQVVSPPGKDGTAKINFYLKPHLDHPASNLDAISCGTAVPKICYAYANSGLALLRMAGSAVYILSYPGTGLKIKCVSVRLLGEPDNCFRKSSLLYKTRNSQNLDGGISKMRRRRSTQSAAHDSSLAICIDSSGCVCG